MSDDGIVFTEYIQLIFFGSVFNVNSIWLMVDNITCIRITVYIIQYKIDTFSQIHNVLTKTSKAGVFFMILLW